MDENTLKKNSLCSNKLVMYITKSYEMFRIEFKMAGDEVDGGRVEVGGGSSEEGGNSQSSESMDKQVILIVRNGT